jgi:hypothetical protein
MVVSTIADLRVARSAAGSSPCSPDIRSGLISRSSAARAATWGAAADVPKKLDEKPPEPVTDTPSAADTSGFITPLLVGPRLENNSI